MRLRVPVALLALAWLGLALLGPPPLPRAAAENPLELDKVVIGTWQGQVFGARSVRGGLVRRTLVIKTVRWQEGEWVVEAEFGPTGRRLGLVQASMEMVQDEPMLEFATPDGRAVRLRLVRSEHAWVGTVEIKGGRPMEIRLERVGP